MGNLQVLGALLCSSKAPAHPASPEDAAVWHGLGVHELAAPGCKLRRQERQPGAERVGPELCPLQAPPDILWDMLLVSWEDEGKHLGDTDSFLSPLTPASRCRRAYSA